MTATCPTVAGVLMTDIADKGELTPPFARPASLRPVTRRSLRHTYTSSVVPMIIMPFKVPVTATNAPTLMFFEMPMVKCVTASQ